MGSGVIFERGARLEGEYAGWFTGECRVAELVPLDGPFACAVDNYTYEAGCRSKWHTHPGGQILLVTGGAGWYQEEGAPARELRPGDVVQTAPGVRNWHGAAEGEWLTYLAVIPDVSAGPPDVSDETPEPVTV